ncbi:MAG: hypothetical protein AB7H88_04710 [Vicinamibacterales bacterium]
MQTLTLVVSPALAGIAPASALGQAEAPRPRSSPSPGSLPAGAPPTS